MQAYPATAARLLPPPLLVENTSKFQLRYFSRQPASPPLRTVRTFEADHPVSHYERWAGEITGFYAHPCCGLDKLDGPGEPAWCLRSRIAFCDALGVRPSRWRRHERVTLFLHGLQDRTALEGLHRGVDHARAWSDAHGRCLISSSPYTDWPTVTPELRLAAFRSLLPGWTVELLPLGLDLWFPPRTSLLLFSPPADFSPGRGYRHVTGMPLKGAAIARVSEALRRANPVE
jgi:hypothetical protein